jgi:hypothetical protein
MPPDLLALCLLLRHVTSSVTTSGVLRGRGTDGRVSARRSGRGVTYSVGGVVLLGSDSSVLVHRWLGVRPQGRHSLRVQAPLWRCTCIGVFPLFLPRLPLLLAFCATATVLPPSFCGFAHRPCSPIFPDVLGCHVPVPCGAPHPPHPTAPWDYGVDGACGRCGAPPAPLLRHAQRTLAGPSARADS